MEGKRKPNTSPTIKGPKRLKTTGLEEAEAGLFPGLPEVVDTKVGSFLMLQELQKLRLVSQDWRRICTLEMQKRVISNLVESKSSITISLGQHSFSFHDTWPYEMQTREELVESAIGFADPGGDVSLNLRVDPARAEHLLRTRGYVTVRDFFVDEEEGPAQDYYDIGETGWAVRIQFVEPISKGRAWRLLAQNIQDAKGDDDLPIYGMDSSRLEYAQAYIFALFCTSMPHTIKYSKYEYTYPHPTSPEGGKKDTMFLVTEDGRPFAISYKSSSDRDGTYDN